MDDVAITPPWALGFDPSRGSRITGQVPGIPQVGEDEAEDLTDVAYR